ncbi:hypothetical protein BaRGS_00025481 [Batillaria attramentaria]|uniref:Uncharacterized protein n=1 Tax=Batillaria attramentaria TaxID=370345 RepID=A0ABD0K8B0_9CAEN
MTLALKDILESSQENVVGSDSASILASTSTSFYSTVDIALVGHRDHFPKFDCSDDYEEPTLTSHGLVQVFRGQAVVPTKSMTVDHDLCCRQNEKIHWHTFHHYRCLNATKDLKSGVTTLKNQQGFTVNLSTKSLSASLVKSRCLPAHLEMLCFLPTQHASWVQEISETNADGGTLATLSVIAPGHESSPHAPGNQGGRPNCKSVSGDGKKWPATSGE